jgi:hypothetical protein
MTCLRSLQLRDFQELPVAQGDVLGAHLRVGRAQQVLVVEVLLGLRPGGVDPQEAAGGDAQVAVQPGPGGDDPAQFGPLVLGERVRAVDEFLELGDHAGADGGVPLGSFGVVADDEPLRGAAYK